MNDSMTEFINEAWPLVLLLALWIAASMWEHRHDG